MFSSSSANLQNKKIMSSFRPITMVCASIERKMSCVTNFIYRCFGLEKVALLRRNNVMCIVRNDGGLNFKLARRECKEKQISLERV